MYGNLTSEMTEKGLLGLYSADLVSGTVSFKGNQPVLLLPHSSGAAGTFSALEPPPHFPSGEVSTAARPPHCPWEVA